MMVGEADSPSRYALFRPGVNDAYGQLTANGGSFQYNPRRSGAAAPGLLRNLDGFLESGARWSCDVVKPAFDYAILNAGSSGNDSLGRFLTGMRVVATASSDALSGTAAMGRLFTSGEAREAFCRRHRHVPQGTGGQRQPRLL
jgi:hypothetical protein